MTSVERVGQQSREQHHRYYGLFGSDPANGDGFAELCTSIRELGQQAADAHAHLARTEFTSAADAGLAAALRGDRDAFGAAATVASAAAAAADGSAQLNLRGAAAIAAHMEGEAATLSVIPDKHSPDGMMQSLATIDNHQTKSLSTVEQFASTAQDLGQFAQMAGAHSFPAPPQLSQLSQGHSWEALAQSSSIPGPQPLSQPSAAPPAHDHSAPLEAASAPLEHLREMTRQDSAPPAHPEIEQTHQRPDPPQPDEHVEVVAANTDNRSQPDVRRTKPQHR